MNEGAPRAETKKEVDLSQKQTLQKLVEDIKSLAENQAEDLRSNMATGIRFLRIIKKLWDAPREPVYSALDLTYSGLNKEIENPELRYNQREHQKRTFERTSEAYEGDGAVELVFLPWGSEIDFSEMAGLLPKWNKTVAFTTPGGFVNRDPEITKEIFLNVIKEAKEEIANLLKQNPEQKINVTSYSASNGAGFFTANDLVPKENQGKFTSVVTGSGMGREIFESEILSKIKSDSEKMGIESGDMFNKVMYDKEYGFLLPIHHCNNLPDQTEIVIGDNDVYIPAKFAKEIGEEARSRNPNVKMTHYQFGHIGTVLYKAHLEQLKHSKLVLSVVENISPAVVAEYTELFNKRGLKLPEEDMRIWSAVFTILCRSANVPENQKLLETDEVGRTIEGIAHDFLVSILPESNNKYANWLARVSNLGRKTGWFATKAA